MTPKGVLSSQKMDPKKFPNAEPRETVPLDFKPQGNENTVLSNVTDIFPAPAKTCPWIPCSLNHRIGRSKERSAKAVTARSPPMESHLEESSHSAVIPSLLCLRCSVGPNPLVLNPHNVTGPPRVHTGEKSPPK
ncbi:hypothetical protein Lal_00010918 [Lupinus albus]|nr:hypothetical protein Lal_00010918 [Lupinus albus]